MCSTVKQVDSNSSIVKELKLHLTPNFKEGADIYPKGQIALITDDEANTLQDAYWSIIPNWSAEFKAPKYSTFNAKKENLFNSKTWQPLIGKKHCVLVCKGFYEWHWDDPINKKGSHRYYLKQKDSEITFMAGLWQSWKNKDNGEVLKSCTMITNPANDMMAEIHNVNRRMPAFLTNYSYKHWIDIDLSINERLELIDPVENDFLIFQEVAKTS